MTDDKTKVGGLTHKIPFPAGPKTMTEAVGEVGAEEQRKFRENVGRLVYAAKLARDFLTDSTFAKRKLTELEAEIYRALVEALAPFAACVPSNKLWNINYGTADVLRCGVIGLSSFHSFSFVGDSTEVPEGTPCQCGATTYKKPRPLTAEEKQGESE